MTELSKRATPEVDGAEVYLDRVSIPITGKWVGSPFARSLEQRLGAVTEALEWMIECYATAPDDRREGGYVLTKKQALEQARETLAAIKEKK